MLPKLKEENIRFLQIIFILSHPPEESLLYLSAFTKPLEPLRRARISTDLAWKVGSLRRLCEAGIGLSSEYQNSD